MSAAERIAGWTPQGAQYRADSLAGGGSPPGPGAPARATLPADSADAGNGAQPFAAKGHGGEGALVARENLGAHYGGHAKRGPRPVGDLEGTPGVGGQTDAANRNAAAKGGPGQLFFGEGELTHELLAGELIDPQRFRNARQVGNYFGLCPSESTSAQRGTWVRLPSTAIPGCAACWSSSPGG